MPGGDDPTFVSGVSVFGRFSVKLEVPFVGSSGFTADVPVLVELVDPIPRVSDGVFLDSSCDPEAVLSDVPPCIESSAVSDCVERA